MPMYRVTIYDRRNPKNEGISTHEVEGENEVSMLDALSLVVPWDELICVKKISGSETIGEGETPMSNELKEALKKLAAMKEPSLEKILRKRGFGSEADVVKVVIDTFEKEKADGK